jgi:hypothetical protein
MLRVPGEGSSHRDESGQGIHARSLGTWQSDVNSVEKWLFQTLTDDEWRPD